MPPELPPPRRAGRYRVALVCLGNICRSPMAHVVLEARLAEEGLDDRVEVWSAGTGGWHVGEPMDRRAAATLAAAGHDPSGHRGQQVAASWFDEADLVLAMDSSNLTDLRELRATPAGPPPGTPERLRLFRDFDPDLDPDLSPGAADRDVPDPYYGGDDGFDHVLALVERTCAALVQHLGDVLGPASGGASGRGGTLVP